MDFSKFQLMWDEESKQSMFAVNQETLNQLVDKEAKSIRFHLRSYELVTMTSFFALAIVIGLEPLLEKHDYFQYYEAAMFFVVSIVMFIRTRQRASGEATFDSSLVGQVDLAIWRLQSLIGRMREYVWLAIAPMLTMYVVRIVFELASKPLWLTILFPIMLLSIPVFNHLHIARKLVPGLRSLKALRETLRGKVLEGE